MASIQILLLAGPQQGQLLELSSDELTFGRQSDCSISIAGDFVSREHGTISFDNDQWILENQSPNGTKVNHKKVGRKGFKLLDQDIVQIGDEDVFQIMIPQSITATPAEIDQSTHPKRKQSNRNKIWIAIGSYLVIACFGLIYLGTLQKSEDQGIEKPNELTMTQIAQVIRTPYQVQVANERAAADFLREAEELYNRQDISIDGTYRVYHAYQMALAHNQKTYFENGLHQLRFDQIQKQLIDKVSDKYNDAFGRLRSREYRFAEKQFRKLNEYYPDTTTELFKNCEAQRHYIRVMLKKYKR